MSRLSRNIFYNVLGQGLLLVLGFVAVKYVFSRLGEDALGIICFALMISTILSTLLEMGICATVVREVAAYFEHEPDYICTLIRSVSLLYWGAYVLLVTAIYFGAPFLAEKWINLTEMDAATATRMLQILGVGVLTSLPRALYASLLRGVQRMEFNNLIEVLSNSFQQFGIIGILAMGGDLLQVTYWLAISFVLTLLSYLIAVARFFPLQALIPGYSFAVIKRNLRNASNMMAISLLAMVHTQSDKVIVSKLLPIGLFSYYNFAYSAISKVDLLRNAVAQAAFPSFSSLFKTGERDSMMSQYRKLQDLVCFGTTPLFAAITFGTLPVFGLVFNPEVARMLLLPIVFLSLGFYMNGTLTVPHVFSLAVGKPEISARTNFYALFIVLPVTVLLIYFFGFLGAAMSWVFYHLFGYSYGLPRICAECLKIPLISWYLHVLKILALTSLTYGMAWAILEVVGIISILSLTLAYMGASTVFLIVAYWMISEELRETLFRLPLVGRLRGIEIL